MVLRNGDLVAMAGDTIDGVQITEIPNHRPAIGEDGSVVFIARHAGGFGVFTPSSLVLSEGQMVGTRAIDAVIALAINDEGTIGTHVHLEGDFYGIVLASPVPEPSVVWGATACALTIAALAWSRRRAGATGL